MFIRSIEALDKEQLENKLLNFQKETAKDAILSSFERLIDHNFFEIIKSDILNAKFQRHDLRWHYDIERYELTNSMSLTRTISYLLRNLTTTEQIENVYIATFSTAHCSTETIAVKCKIDGHDSYSDLTLQNEMQSGTLINTYREIKVPGAKTAEVVVIFKQIFPRDYIYETHFLNQGGIGLELTVNLPKGYEFSVNPTVLAARTEKLVDEETKKVFRFKGAIYKGQGIEFMCFKKTSFEEDAQKGLHMSS